MSKKELSFLGWQHACLLAALWDPGLSSRKMICVNDLILVSRWSWSWSHLQMSTQTNGRTPWYNSGVPVSMVIQRTRTCHENLVNRNLKLRCEKTWARSLFDKRWCQQVNYTISMNGTNIRLLSIYFSYRMLLSIRLSAIRTSWPRHSYSFRCCRRIKVKGFICFRYLKPLTFLSRSTFPYNVTYNLDSPKPLLHISRAM